MAIGNGGLNSYSMSMGDHMGRWQWELNNHANVRGMFSTRGHTAHGQITDGTSNTLLYSERLVSSQPYPNATGNTGTVARTVRHRETIAQVPTSSKIRLPVGKFPMDSILLRNRSPRKRSKFWHDGTPHLCGV